jgi:hypothetical protein
LYSLQRLKQVRLEALLEIFDALPLDPYLGEEYRYRCFSRFRLAGGELVQLPPEPFIQRSEHNPLLGGVSREYAELDADLTPAEDFRSILRDFLGQCESLPDETELGVHQIRVVSERGRVGRPTPEGIHADGFDYVGIFCVGRCDVSGGETYLYESKDGPPVYRTLLEPGDLLVFNDRGLYHYTSPILAPDTRRGTRDVFILTAWTSPKLTPARVRPTRRQLNRHHRR